MDLISFTVCMYAHGNHYGVTRRSQETPNFVMYLNKLIKLQSQGNLSGDITWTTFALGLDAGSLPHRDVHNRAGSKNVVIGVGKFKEGALWIQDPKGNDVCELPNGETIYVRNLNVKNKIVEFDPKKWHGSRGWTGRRFIISAYTSRGFDEASDKDLKTAGLSIA